LKKKGPEASLAAEIVAHHLPLLEKRAWQDLAKILAVDIQQIRNAADLIIHLEPKPGRTFYSEEPIAVTPDATVTFSRDENEKFKIEIHDEAIRELRINPYYRRLLRDKQSDSKTRAFIREKIQSGINFLRALSLRKSTLREITEELVRVQSRFFEKGFSQLVPLRLKDVANRLGIHESTVSRALQGKYISTPQGTIPYKSFFSSKMETTHGEAESQKSILEKVRALIGKENPAHPLSDQEIVKILRDEGLVIARRTVAKYRDLLKILPSHLRRRK
ncbi:MAG TPA: RNA polymerase sigma-54 factor, partial [bacterium]|nr:RNA polymerase sigma-54 factor [bacterium]